ncbi:MAG: hypothetical protein GY913_10765 [Proteobacteria bacterium]|nr:hypothetical protein [Actinomycetes bacterium]MCP4917394.1 hypothetical protein [Pseudomonadota bacterium]
MIVRVVVLVLGCRGPGVLVVVLGLGGRGSCLALRRSRDSGSPAAWAAMLTRLVQRHA